MRRIVGNSMYPTFDEGEVIIARTKHEVRAGDIVVFLHKDMEKIKRVSEVEEQRIYVLGDNPNYSTDSRHFGMVPKEDILGVVIWPR